MRAWRVGVAGLLLSLAACGGIEPQTGAAKSGDDPRCAAYCNARQAKGCAGDLSNCKLACNVDYAVVPQSQGSCQQTYTALADCKNDPAILGLGCAPPTSKIDEFCKTQREAYQACVKQRDGT